MKELLIRGISGTVFLALVFVPLYFDGSSCGNLFAITLYFFSLIGAIELQKISGNRKMIIPSVILTTALYAPVLMNSICRPSEMKYSFPAALTTSLLIAWAVCIVVFIVLVFRDKLVSSLLNYSLLTSIFYPVIPFLLLALSLDSSAPEDRYILMLILLPIYINDTFAYATGRLVGKRKMFPAVSPKKTWEGFIGGVTGAQVIMHIIIYSVVDTYNGRIALIVTVFSLAASILATFGDLFESKLKRTAGVKDSGTIIPGHGGVLDRVDAMLFVAPLLYVLLQLILKF